MTSTTEASHRAGSSTTPIQLNPSGRLTGTAYDCRNLSSTPRLLLFVEGRNDIEFLKRLSSMLSSRDNRIVDLAELERAGRVVIVPCGGGGLDGWSERLMPFGCFQFHLLDREMAPESELRRHAARIINSRKNCQAVVTKKRALENYLHPEAIREALGVEVQFGDDDQVADLVAQALLPSCCGWRDLSRRAQRRLRYRIKRSLNTRAADCMTPERLAERDPAGEVAGLLSTIGEMVHLR